MCAARTLEQDLAEVCGMEGTLRARLQALGSAIRKHEPQFSDAYESLVLQFRSSGVGNAAPGIGELMPFFLLPDVHGHLVLLDELLSRGPVVVSFNRGHWCEYCDLELKAFAAAHSEIVYRGATVVAILPERLEYIRKVSERTQNKLVVLADIDNSYALTLNLAVWLGDRVQTLLTSMGLSLSKAQASDTWFVPIPATFVVGTDGRIIARHVDPDFRQRMEIDEILAALRRA